jgi:hypothetical protein
LPCDPRVHKRGEGARIDDKRKFVTVAYAAPDGNEVIAPQLDPDIAGMLPKRDR